MPLQATAPLTDFVYAGMFYNQDSGLYLTNYRAFDPVAGRWLSRDPIGEASDPAANLYVYVYGYPLGNIDPFGLQGEPPYAVGHHWVIGPIRNNPDLSPEARQVFRNSATDYFGELHGWDKGHSEYNRGVQELWERNNYDPSKMTKMDAEGFVNQIRRSTDPRISNYRQMIWDKCLKYGMRRMPFTPRNEE